MPTPDRDTEPVSDQLVTIARFDNAAHAHLYRQRLEIEGFQCFIQDEAVSRLVYPSLAMVGGVKLQVCESDVPRLRELIQGDPELAQPGGIDANALQTPEACPQCGSERITRLPVSIFRALLLLVNAGNNKPRWKCGKCQHRWHE
jgi:hypothetical protein